MRSTWIRWILGGAVLVTALAVSLTAKGPGPREAIGRSPERNRVRLADVEPASAAERVRFPGQVRSADRARLAFTVSGRLESRPVELGDEVRGGQLIATIESEGLANHLRQAEARVTEIEAELDRQRAEAARVEILFSREAATREELESVTAGRDRLLASEKAARAALREARRRFGERRLEAPFRGTVVGVSREPGEWVAPGETVVTVAGLEALELVIDVPAPFVRGLEKGRAVTVETVGSVEPARIRGEILGVGAAGGGPGSLRPLRIGLNSASTTLGDGDTAVALLPVSGGSRVTVPLGAIVDPSGTSPAVFRFEDGGVERVEVRVWKLDGDRVGVEGALEPGDEVVVAGQGRLLDGDEVEVLR